MKNLFLYLSIVAVLFVSCSADKKQEHAAGHNHAEMASKKYTCPMHPQIVQDKPGKCPICGMDLVLSDKGETNTNSLMLNDSQIRLANITTQIVTEQPIGQTVVVNGTLTENKNLSEVISSRVAGRIEKLFIKETGRPVRQGEPLYEIYSETLLTLQREYLLAKEQYDVLGKQEARYKSFLDAAEKKLLLYGLTQNQVDKLSQSNVIQNRITFLSPAKGIVKEINAAEGQYVGEGADLYRIEDVSSLWVEAELYPGETSLVKVGDKIEVQISGAENSSSEATVSFLSPEYRAGSQIIIMRALLQNKEMNLIPGMQAQILLTHSSTKALAVPVDAVIRDGRGTHVYIQKGRNTFQPQMVKTGVENVSHVQITEGLQAGDTVAVTGAYLLYSELILKKGVDPMAGHHH